MPCPWEKRFSKCSGGGVSDLSILSSRILKNGRMAKRVRSIQNCADIGNREGGVWPEEHRVFRKASSQQGAG